MACSIKYVQEAQLPESEKLRLENVHVKVFTDAKRSGAFREYENRLYSKKDAYGPAVAFVNRINRDNGVEIAKLNKASTGQYYLSVNVLNLSENQGDLFQLPSTESSKSSEKTISLIKEFLKKIGVEVKTGDIVVNGVKIDANGVALLTQKLIQIAEGKTDVALTEEAMHFAVEIIKQKDPALYKKLLSEIGNYKLTKQVFEQYGNNPEYQIDGKPNVIKLKEEAIGKILAETIINKNEGSTENPELLAKVEGWWNSIIEALKRIFSKSGFDQAAMKILSGEFEGTAEDIKSNTIFLQENVSPQKQIIDKLKAISATISKLPDDGGYEINGKKIKHRVSDISKTWYENRLGDKNLTKSEFAEAVDDLKKEKGTAGHADIQHILQDVLLDKDGRFIKDPNNRPNDSGYVSQIDPNNRGIYNALKDNLIERLASFPEDTVILPEITIYNPTRDLAGTIDFLAIEPSGKTHILDWKFMDLNVEHYEDVPWYKVGAWNTQMTNYKLILKNAYNIPFNGSEQTRMIPIRAKYTLGNAKANILPRLESIEIGGINLKDEKRSYLLPVGLPEERTGNKRIDHLVEQLNKVYDFLSTKSVSNEGKVQKAEQLNALYKAVRQLQMRQNIQPLIEQAKVLNKEVGNLITEFNTTSKEKGSIPKENREEFSRRIIGLENSLRIYTSLYTNLKGLFVGDALTEEQSKLKEALKKTSEDATDLENDLNDIRQQFSEQIANDENILDFLAPEKIVKGLSRWFGSTSSLQVKSVQILYKMANRALSKATIDTTEQGNILKDIKNKYDVWAKSKGLSNKNYFSILKKGNSNELIDEFDKQFFKDLKSKIHDKDRKWVMENVNVSRAKQGIKEAKEQEYIRIEQKVRHHDNPEDSVREVQLEKIKADELYNVSTIDSPGWLLYNIVKQFPKEKWVTEEWKELHKKGNEPALAFYNYIIERNDKYEELGYIAHSARTFLPWIRKSMIERLVMDGKLIVGESLLRGVTVSEGDVGYGQLDPITKEPVYNIPKYFTKDVGEEVSGDLFKNMTLLNEMAIRYEYLSEIESQMNLIIKTESNKSAIKTSYFGKTKYKSDGEVEITSDNTENTKLVKDMMEAIVYGHKYIESENFDQLLGSIGNFGKKANKILGLNIFPEKFDNAQLSLNKSVTTLNNFFQLKTLGFNPISALSNFLGGSFQSYINAGTYFTKAEFLKNEFLIAGRLNGVDAKKYLAALEYFVPLTENYNTILAKNLSISKYTPENIQDILMWMMRKGDQYVQSVNFFSYLDNSILLDGKIINAREFLRNTEEYQNIYNISSQERKQLEKQFEEKVKELIEEKGLLKLSQFKDNQLVIPGIDKKSDSVIELRRKVQSLTKDALGNLSEDDIRKINLNIMGKSFMIFKNWIPRLVDVRFGNLKYNSASDAYEWGRTRMMLRVLFSDFTKTISNLSSAIAGNDEKWVGQMKQLWEAKREEYKKDTGKELKMTEKQFLDLVRKNINNQLTDFLFYASLTGLFIGASALSPDDDKDRSTKNRYKFLLRVLDKVRDEIAYFYNPTSLASLTTSGIFPSLSYLTNLQTIIANFGKEMYYIGTENEKAQEKNQVIKYLLKGFPITSQFDSILLMFYPDLAKELNIVASSQSKPLGK